MSTYTDDIATDYPDYADDSDYTDYSSDVDGYDDTAEATSCCCGPAEAPVFEDWPELDPGSYDETGGVWDDGQSDASAVIPAGQPGGPELQTSSAAAVMPAGQPGTTDWQPVADTSGLYPTVATIGGDQQQAMTFEPGEGFGTGFSSYGTALESPTGAPIYDGGGFEPYGSAAPTLTELINSWGTGPAQPTGPVFEPTTMYINSEPSALAQIYGVAAANGDIMSQLAVRDIMISQANMARVWTI